jgi:hypothetical protein
VYVFCDNDMVMMAPSRRLERYLAASRCGARSDMSPPIPHHLSHRDLATKTPCGDAAIPEHATRSASERVATLFTSNDYAGMPIYVMTLRRIRSLAELAAANGSAFISPVRRSKSRWFGASDGG